MKRVWLLALIVSLCLSATCFGQSLILGGLPVPSSLTDDVKVSPYAQLGFQWVGANLSLPVQNEALTPFLNIGEFAISLRDANFWSGTAGFTITAKEMFSLFAAAGGILNRSFLTDATVPVSLGEESSSADLVLTNTQVESWFIQTGVGLGPVLLGLYWDHFAFALEDPRDQDGPIANQTLRADILTKTFAPFVGLAVPAGGAMLTVQYSPLAYCNTSLALRTSQDRLSELRYDWNKPGDLVMAMLQYNTPLTSSTSFGLWGVYSWLSMRHDADLEFESTPVPLISRSREVTATMTQYIIGGGVSLVVEF